jgi:hypothetical protein
MNQFEEYEVNSEENAEAEKDDKKRNLLRIARIREIMHTKGFYEVVNLVLDISNFNGNNYVPNSDETVYLEGRRSVFIDMLAVLEECDLYYYSKLLKEKAEEVENGRRE